MNDKMKNKINNKNKNGFTLIEVIISIAILGIISISLLTLFTTGFKFITNSGRRSADDSDIQTEVENALNSAPDTNTGLVITLPDSSTINGDGEVKTETSGDVTVTFFVPLN